MLFAIALSKANHGLLRAHAPDLLNCDLTGATEEEVLPRLRLAIEGELTRLLLAGAPLPDARNGEPLPERVQPPVRWLTVHVNIAHLEALARHQARYQASHQAGR